VRLRPGGPAPGSRLPDQGGRPVDLEDLRRRRVVRYFGPRDDTPGCATEACQFDPALEEFAALGVEVLGVSGDDAAGHRSFRDGHGLRFRLLSDTGHRVAAAYGAFGERRRYGRPVTGVIHSASPSTRRGR
jgi:peroxiredoxin Q/BCP